MLKALSKAAVGWEVWDEATEETFVPITEEPFTFAVDDGLLSLFDSAYSGNAVSGGQVLGGVIMIDLAPGAYRVESAQLESAQYRPDSETWFDLHRLSRRED